MSPCLLSADWSGLEKDAHLGLCKWDKPSKGTEYGAHRGSEVLCRATGQINT